MQGEREGDPSSLFLLPNKNSNQNQQRIPLEHVRES